MATKNNPSITIMGFTHDDLTVTKVGHCYMLRFGDMHSYAISPKQAKALSDFVISHEESQPTPQESKNRVSLWRNTNGEKSIRIQWGTQLDQLLTPTRASIMVDEINSLLSDLVDTPQSAPSTVQDKLRVNLRGWQFDVTKDEALVLIKELAAFL